MNKEYIMYTNWATALIITNVHGVIIDSAPIYRKFIGKNIKELKYKIFELFQDDV